MPNSLKEALDKASREFEKRMEQRREQDARVQRSRVETPDEKAQRGIDYLTRNIKQHAEQHGKEITAEQARREAVQVAERVDRKKE